MDPKDTGSGEANGIKKAIKTEVDMEEDSKENDAVATDKGKSKDIHEGEPSEQTGVGKTVKDEVPLNAIKGETSKPLLPLNIDVLPGGLLRCTRSDGRHWRCVEPALPGKQKCEKHCVRSLICNIVSAMIVCFQ